MTIEKKGKTEQWCEQKDVVAKDLKVIQLHNEKQIKNTSQDNENKAN